ncbi:3-deoxy-D-manno-octulosonic acid transferase [Thermodesulfobacterium sp. TA1]|uniref:3-deoxy-D-manno-octulosonic acid transferase n=1 Tax=Thermodesulfobacterium sp. TA1 TaxID=2234087 RepID=UPI0012324D2A|nr:3-deoxy-D-manno-octulosonic acid transferase [Thermodesulfobacterium sp. TA1]QER42138.1 3-deoxy-D-manno-octulosonic acid transferase [Thermodesulfobacterium sp. TA1]
MFWVYTLIYYLVAGLLLPKEFLKRPPELRLKWLKDKFALFKKSENFSSGSTIWVHCVSVGEVIALSSLVKRLSNNHNILISTITDTGQKVAKDRFKGLSVEVIYLPLDCPFAIKRTLKAFNLKALVISETEIWPNLIHTAAQEIPVFLVNARLSQKSFKNYQKIKFFIRRVLEDLTLIVVQDNLYKKRFKALGVPEEKIIVAGNTKFDLEIPYVEFPWEDRLKKPVIIAGSTHHPEEEIITEAFLSVVEEGTLLLAPRHPERFEEVFSRITSLISNQKENRFYRLSSLNYEKLNLQDAKRIILLVDQIGILGSLYRLCDLAIIGGSFIPHGGQNPLEPIYWKKPVVFGPSMENFPFVQEFLEKKACLQVSSEKLAETLKDLLNNPQKLENLSKKAYQIYRSKTGATERIIRLLEKYL